MFCEAAIEAVRVLPFGAGEDCVFVANDWHSALVPVLIKDKYQVLPDINLYIYTLNTDTQCFYVTT